MPAKRKWTSRDWKFLNGLNAIPVTREELWDLAGASAARHRELRLQRADAGGAIYFVASKYRGAPDQGMAVYFRMQALARLVESGDLPGWTQTVSRDGAVPIHDALFAAAATEPLVRVGDDIGFERGSFLRRALDEAEPDGSAWTPRS